VKICTPKHFDHCYIDGGILRLDALPDLLQARIGKMFSQELVDSHVRDAR
jgi:hypothetical protein